MYQALKGLIEAKKAKVCIVGLGYVGLPIAVEFARKGFCVFGYEAKKSRVDRLKKGISYIDDISDNDIKGMLKKDFHPTDKEGILKQSDVVIICVPTPLRKTKVPNISYILAASRNIARYLRKGQLVVLESTTYPGTTRDAVLPILEGSGLKCGQDFFLAFSPERIDPGNKKYTFASIPKIVGGIDKRSTELARMLYSKVIDRAVPVSSLETAEVAKLLENTFRIVNIGLINEFAMLCNKLKIDVWEVVDAARTKPFGFMPFYPGPGIGGHCLAEKEAIFIKNGHGIEATTIGSFVDKMSKGSLSITKNINNVLYIKPPADYKILTFDTNMKKSQFKNITMLSKRRTDAELYEFVTNDNRKICVTDLHPMLVCSDGELEVKFAKDLRMGDKIPHIPSFNNNRKIISNSSFEKHKGYATSVIKNIRKLKGEYVYSAEVENTHTIVTSYGIIVHNCIPKDPLYLSWKARKVGFKARMIDLASKTNLSMPHYVIRKAQLLLKKQGRDISRAKILVLGVTYKKDVKDLRESPALDIIKILQDKKAKVSYSDLYVPYLKINSIDLKDTKLTQKSIKHKDLLILATDHKKFDYKMISKRARLILDTRNAFEKVGIKASHIVKL